LPSSPSTSSKRHFEVRIDLRIPGHELVVNHKDDEDVYVALREAFASMVRRLEDTARRQAPLRLKRSPVPDNPALLLRRNHATAVCFCAVAA
jgi:hypothetical protein